ncbi:MAG: outer membrane beta-barrel protein [Flavisolibacter sp.]
MQYVNDDMDELLRRAAENYPLDTRGANWNKVLALMDGESGEKTVSEKKQNNNRRFLWLLLLLPLGFVCNQIYTPGFLNGKAGQRMMEADSKGAIKKSASEDVTIDSKVGPVQDKTNEGLSVQQKAGLPGREDGVNGKVLVFTGVQKNKTFYDANTAHSGKSLSPTQNNVDATLSFNQDISETKGIDADATRQSFLANRIFVTGIPYRSRELRPNYVTADMTPIPLGESPTKGAKAVVHVTKPKRFYAGLMGGLDATTIKLQKIENTGFSYGLLGGYQLNRKWSIETGAYLERKYYYSDGKYFNTSKIYMPANSRISEVSGNCKMIEVPVSARYIFSSQKGAKWFSTFGLSSYFMTEENYTYDYYYGSVGPVSHTKQYTNGSTKLFSNISLSAGYTRPLGNFADLRIEPYFKLPLSGLGVGSLPLFSMGLQVGVTKKF